MLAAAYKGATLGGLEPGQEVNFEVDLMARYAAPYLKTLPIGSFGDDGAGLRLGVSAGAVADQLDKISAWRFINPPYDWTKGVIIGASGERITNEEQYGAHLSRAIYGKSDGRAWLIVDQAIWDAALEEVRSGKLFGFQQFPVKQAQKSAQRADSIEGLAGKLGVDAHTPQPESSPRIPLATLGSRTA